jgi:D-proline reductase (dithiol) PrdB
MARLEQMIESERSHLLALPCPTFDSTPWVTGPPIKNRRIALISTAGLHCRGDRPFEPGAVDYRVIPADTPAENLIMSHISVNYDRTGFQQDWNVVFPLDRLRELAQQKIIGGIADYHYSFMGATDPKQMESTVRDLAGIMIKEGVDSVLLVPV